MAATVTTSARPGDDVDPGGPPSATTLAEGRGRYLDTLVALALIGIVTFHQFGWHWLPLAFPSMGVGYGKQDQVEHCRGHFWSRAASPAWRPIWPWPSQA